MKRLVVVFALLLTAGITWYTWSFYKEEKGKTRIQLRWIKAYPAETKENVTLGMAWVFSFLGAELPKGSLEKAMVWKSESLFTLDLAELGFTNQALAAFKQILPSLKGSAEYQSRGGIDLGRFIMFTLNSAQHYYAITGAHSKYDQFRQQYRFGDRRAAIIKSTVALGNRLIELSDVQKFQDIAFVALEGDGSVADGNFQTREFEVLDFMTNGQIRFAMYDSLGNIKMGANASLTNAGKPAKCLWCHEINLLPPFEDNHQLAGFYSTVDFKEAIDQRALLVNAYRATLNSDVNFNNAQDHTQGELLYLSFLEPSADRLAGEWGVSKEDVQEKLKHLVTHAHHEFDYLGDSLYYRKDVEALAPYANLRLPDDARNTSLYEPNFIHGF